MHRVLLVTFRVVGSLATANACVFAVAACFLELAFPNGAVKVTDPGIWPSLTAVSTLLVAVIIFRVWTDSSDDEPSHSRRQRVKIRTVNGVRVRVANPPVSEIPPLRSYCLDFPDEHRRLYTPDLSIPPGPDNS